MTYHADELIVKNIQIIEKKWLLELPKEAADSKFLLDVLRNENCAESVWISATTVLTEADDAVLDEFLQAFSSFCSQAQVLAYLQMACTDYVHMYVRLLDELSHTRDDGRVGVLVSVLSSTHYPVLPLVIERLSHDDPRVVGRMKQVIFDMGFSQVKAYLLLLPQIPYEAVFRDLFGADQIEQIKQRK
jgi:hypothetical protein